MIGNKRDIYFQQKNKQKQKDWNDASKIEQNRRTKNWHRFIILFVENIKTVDFM